jgi:phage-related protein
MGSTRRDLHAFPEEVEDEMGHALYLAQIGQMSPLAKPMHGALRDVMEIVEQDASGAYRVMYTVKIGDVVYALHAFQKKATHGIAMSKGDLDLIERRLRAARKYHEENRC